MVLYSRHVSLNPCGEVTRGTCLLHENRALVENFGNLNGTLNKHLTSSFVPRSRSEFLAELNLDAANNAMQLIEIFLDIALMEECRQLHDKYLSENFHNLDYLKLNQI